MEADIVHQLTEREREMERIMEEKERKLVSLMEARERDERRQEEVERRRSELLSCDTVKQ